VFKLVCFLKRRPDLSREDFMRYYESKHRKLGERYCPKAKRYFRRYLQPLPDVVTGAFGDFDYDVITEMWFEDEAAYRAAMADITRPEAAAAIGTDEDNLFDRSMNRLFVVEEHESVMIE
jgi:EthD domain